MNIPHITTCDFECDEVKGLIKKSLNPHMRTQTITILIYINRICLVFIFNFSKACK